MHIFGFIPIPSTLFIPLFTLVSRMLRTPILIHFYLADVFFVSNSPLDLPCFSPTFVFPLCYCLYLLQFSSVQLLSHVQHFVTPWTAARQDSLSIINSRSLPKLMSIELVMPSNHLILCCSRLLPPSIFLSIRVFSDESALCIRWPKYWSFSFNISPSKEHSGLISFRMDWLDLLAVQKLSRVFSNTTVQKHQFFSTQLSL